MAECKANMLTLAGVSTTIYSVRLTEEIVHHAEHTLAGP